jgi:hypothetical protein
VRTLEGIYFKNTSGTISGNPVRNLTDTELVRLSTLIAKAFWHPP